MPNDKKTKNEKEGIRDTKIRVSEIIEFGQKISNDWLDVETQRKVTLQEQKQSQKNKKEVEETDTPEEEQSSTIPNIRSYTYS